MESGLPTLVAVLVSFNRLSHLKQGVEAVLAEPVSGLVVVDNGSTDGSREWLESLEDPRLKVLLPDENLGGAGGFEIGFQAALETFSPDWLVCFDDDARPAPGALKAFIEHEGLESFDSAAAAVYYPDGSICEMNRPSWNPFWHKRKLLKTIVGLLTGRSRQGFHMPHSHYHESEPVAVDSSSFVGFFASAEMVRRVGLPEGRLFIYADDMIYTLKITRAGGRHRFLPHIHFIHDCSTFQDKVRTYAPLWKAFYWYRNGVCLYRVAAGNWFPLVLPVKLLSWLLSVRHYDDKGRYLSLCWLAVRDALRRDFSRSHSEITKRFP